MNSLMAMETDTCTLTTSPHVNSSQTVSSLVLCETLNPSSYARLSSTTDLSFLPLSGGHRDEFTPWGGEINNVTVKIPKHTSHPGKQTL